MNHIIDISEGQKDKRVMNTTALIIANNKDKKDQLINHLTATGLFQQIKPLGSSDDLFQHLKSKPADMVCWAIENEGQKATWISKLHANEKWHDLPLIAFAEDQQGLLNGYQLGASDSVYVEIDPIELSARMNRHLERWQRLLELRQSKEQLQKMALTDPLTKLGNRATFDMSIKQASACSQRSGVPYSLLMIDLDHFKRFNDTYGHQTGDSVLRLVADAIQTSARNADICCRYGGEEFAVILPDTKGNNAEVLAKRIHKQVAKVSQQQPAGRLPITISIGISCANRGSNIHPAQLIEEADQALYQAKENGRNRTEVWQATDIISRVSSFDYTAAPQLAFGSY
ncbi:response regulator receiver modulated diguanylate cyclase [Desulfuromusa kysingii]|uniref:diguanylate cyclase n=1 Tax=Desulfuromusa kysingii TaxID=37625 RepID=A0A1H3VN60_9BACT|nr:GGDEF domain-containing protein [Desulfuromusa kysingii]SDZ76141.1 response regulator receiver modulated diguanylate cyclase [Desulfuromusa kysingii]